MKRSNVLKIFLATNVVLSLGLVSGTAWGRCARIYTGDTCGDDSWKIYVENTCDNRAVKATVEVCERKGDSSPCRETVVQVLPGSRSTMVGCTKSGFKYYEYDVVSEE